MTPEQTSRLRAISKSVAEFEGELQTSDVSNLYAATHEDVGGALVISANAEGLTYFASVLLSLAADAKEHKHFHYDRTTVLSECEKPLIIKFQSAPWERPAPN
jgi:hypothetical protein